MTSFLGRIAADFETQLALKISVGGTTGTLASATDDDGVALPAGRYFFTIDKDSSKKEHISCTLSGTSLTNIKTVSRQGVETSGVLREHKVGANVIISDFAHIKKINDLLDGSTDFDGATPLKYDSQPSLSDPAELATVQYVLDTATGGTVDFSTQTVSGIAGEILTKANIVYFKESDQKWWKSDADVSATFDQVRLGIVVADALANAGVTIVLNGPADYFTGLTAGSKYYLSNTAGGVTTSSSQTTQVFLGVATNTTTLSFTPLSIYIPTALEKAAISGLAFFTGAMFPTQRRTAPSGFLLCDGSAVSRTTYANLFAATVPTGTFTVNISSPSAATFTKVAHTLVEGDIVHFTTTGALPTGITTNTNYYVISTGLTADAFQVSTTRGGSGVVTTGSQSPTHTFFAANNGKGDGSTTFNLPDMRGKTIFGYDVTDNNFDAINTPNTYVGAKTHTLTVAQMPAHTHDVAWRSTAGGGSQAIASTSGLSGGSVTDAATTKGGDGSHNNMPPYSVANWLIKT